jgi:hypothetical protein
MVIYNPRNANEIEMGIPDGNGENFRQFING